MTETEVEGRKIGTIELSKQYQETPNYFPRTVQQDQPIPFSTKFFELNRSLIFYQNLYWY